MTMPTTVTRRFNKLIFILLIIVLLIILIIPPLLNRNAYVYNIATQPEPATLSLSNNEGWQIEPITIKPELQLKGLVHPAVKASAPWVIFLPGNGAEQLKGGQTYLQQLSQLSQDSANWGLAVWPLRGYDGVSGKAEAISFREDYQTIYRYLQKTYGIKASQLHLVGFSFGSDLALQFAADITQSEESPASLALLSTQGMTRAAWSMRENTWYSRWLPADNYDLLPALKIITSPVIIVDAKNDLFGNGEFLLSALNSKPRYIELAEGNHASSLRHPRALAAVHDWISMHAYPSVSNWCNFRETHQRDKSH